MTFSCSPWTLERLQLRTVKCPSFLQEDKKRTPNVKHRLQYHRHRPKRKEKCTKTTAMRQTKNPHMRLIRKKYYFTLNGFCYCCLLSGTTWFFLWLVGWDSHGVALGWSETIRLNTVVVVYEGSNCLCVSVSICLSVFVSVLSVLSFSTNVLHLWG